MESDSCLQMRRPSLWGGDVPSLSPNLRCAQQLPLSVIKLMQRVCVYDIYSLSDLFCDLQNSIAGV